MPNAKKQSQLDSLVDFIQQSANFALIKHEKTKHIALEGLRKELRANDSTVKIVKNSIFEKAVKRLAGTHPHLKTFVEKALPLKESSALIAFGEDWSKGLATTNTFSQKETTVVFKAGVLDNNAYTSDDLVKIAKLPSRGELVAKLIGNMKGPTSSFTYAIKYNMQKFVYILNEKAKKSS